LRTIPEEERVFVISAEGGLLCVQDLVESGFVTGVEVKDTAEVWEAIRLLQDERWRQEYRWVFIDSLTEIARFCWEECAAGFTGRDNRQLCGIFGPAFRKLLVPFRDMSTYDIVATCLEKIKKDVDGHVLGFEPDVVGGSAETLLKSTFDVLVYMDTVTAKDGKRVRAFITHPDNRQPAKDRSGVLAPVEPPDLGLLKRKILEART
jgi:hypothetical protein